MDLIHSATIVFECSGYCIFPYLLFNVYFPIIVLRYFGWENVSDVSYFCIWKLITCNLPLDFLVPLYSRQKDLHANQQSYIFNLGGWLQFLYNILFLNMFNNSAFFITFVWYHIIIHFDAHTCSYFDTCPPSTEQNSSKYFAVRDTVL